MFITKSIIPKEAHEKIAQISEAFAQLIDINKSPPEIIALKTRDLLNILRKYVRMLNLMATFHFFEEETKEEFLNFGKRIISAFSLDLDKEYTESDIFPDQIDYYRAKLEEKDISEYQRRINGNYQKLIGNKEIEEITTTAFYLGKEAACFAYILTPEDDKFSQFSRFHPAKRMNEIKKTAHWNFIAELVDYRPLVFAKSINFAELFRSDRLKMNEVKYCMQGLSHFYWKGYEIFDIVSGANMDASEMSGMFVEALGEFKKKMPGCKNAFRVLENSVNILEKRFDQYYRNSVKSGSASSFVEDFFVDLINENNGDKSLKVEFRKIGNELKKMIGKGDFENAEVARSLLRTLDEVLDMKD